MYTLIRSALAAVAVCLSGLASATGALENPQPGSTQSGIGLVSGWNCNASQITIRVDGAAPTPVAYGAPRGDTAAVCGRTNTGFGLLLNFNLMGAGSHTIVALADGVEFQAATFNVVTLGQEFLRGAAATAQVFGFPDPSRQVMLQWQESKQNFSITGAGPIATSGSLNGSYRLVRSTVDIPGGQIYDTTVGNLSVIGTMVISGNSITQSLTVTVSGQTLSISLSATFADLGAYVSFTQGAQSGRFAVIQRTPLLITESTGPGSGTSPSPSETDQWMLVSQAMDAAIEKSGIDETRTQRASVGGAVGALLVEAGAVAP